jgi:hypothetical protein
MFTDPQPSPALSIPRAPPLALPPIAVLNIGGIIAYGAWTGESPTDGTWKARTNNQLFTITKLERTFFNIKLEFGDLT